MNNNPPAILHRVFDQQHLVWFPESNSWISMQEPAWFVCRLWRNGVEDDIIARRYALRYGMKLNESKEFTGNILHKLKEYSARLPNNPKVYHLSSPSSFYSSHTYRIDKTSFTLRFGSALEEFYGHHALAHLEIKDTVRQSIVFEWFCSGKNHVLKNGSVSWVETDPSRIKRRLFIALSGLIHNKRPGQWLSFVHGAAISRGDHCLVLTTASGSGKSTLAAFLCRNGYTFMSDDIVPIDARHCLAWPFPAAMRVKSGAYDVLTPLYPRLSDAREFAFKNTETTLRYLPFLADESEYRPLPVKVFVFVKYSPGKKEYFRKLNAIESIQKFNENAWLSSQPGHARKFLSWFPEINCFELSYSGFDKLPADFFYETR